MQNLKVNHNVIGNKASMIEDKKNQIEKNPIDLSQNS